MIKVIQSYNAKDFEEKLNEYSSKEGCLNIETHVNVWEGDIAYTAIIYMEGK